MLILGRFTVERKAVLEAMRAALRKLGYVPIIFDFQPPSNRDLTETVSTLAHLAKFIIADITSPRSIPQELATVIPTLCGSSSTGSGGYRNPLWNVSRFLKI